MRCRPSLAVRCGLVALSLVTSCGGGDRSASVAPPPPRHLAVVSGNEQTGWMRSRLPDSLVVRVTDDEGAPVAGASVVWRTAQGTPVTLGAERTTTDAAGRSAVAVTLGDSGTSVVSASLAAASAPATFTLHATELARFARVPASGRPYAVAASTIGRVAVGAVGGYAFFLDSLGGSKDSVNIGGTPEGVTFGPGSLTAWFSRGGSGDVLPVDAGTGAAGAAIPVGPSPSWSIVSPDGAKLFVAADDSVRIVALPSGGRAGAFHTGGAGGMAFDASGSRLYVAAGIARTVVEVDAATGAMLRTFGGFENTVRGVVIDGGFLYAVIDRATAVGRVQVADLASGAIVATISVGSGADAITFNPVARQLVVSTRSGTAEVIDPVARAVVTVVVLGGTPRGIAYDAHGASVIVANENGWIDVLR